MATKTQTKRSAAVAIGDRKERKPGTGRLQWLLPTLAVAILALLTISLLARL